MEETVETPVDDSPLAAFKKFKQGTAPAPQQHSTSAVNPFGDLAIKKKEASEPVSQNGGQPSVNGSAPSQSSPGIDLDYLNKSLKQSGQDTQKRIQSLQTNPNDPYYKELADQRAQYQKDHPGSWSNALPQFEHALVGLVTKPLAGLAHVSVDAAKGLGFSDTDKSLTANLAKGLDSYNNETEKTDYNNPLPDTFLGNTSNAFLHLAPLLIAAKGFPEASAAEDASALTKLKNITINPFTKISAVSGGLEHYDQARQAGLSPKQAAKEGVKGFVQEGGSAATMNILGSIAGEFVAPKLAKTLTENGILSDGKLTAMGTKAASNAAIFGAYPVVSHLIEHGTLPDHKEIESGVGIGLLFGGIDAGKTGMDFTEADQNLLHNRQGLAMKNFIEADPEAIKQAYELPHTAADINGQAVDYAAKAMKETDLDKRKELIAASSTYTKASNVKSVAQAIIANKQGFIDEATNSPDIQPEQKQAIIDKINQTYQTLDPLEKLKADLGGKITALDQQIKQIEPIAAGETDPVKKTEAEVAIENLTKVKEEAQKQLKKSIKAQHKEMLQPQEGENNHAISESSTGKMGVRNETAVRQEVGSNDQSVEPAGQGGATPEPSPEVKADDEKPVGYLESIKAVKDKAKELANKSKATNDKLKDQKADIIDQMQEVKSALNGDNDNIDAVQKAGYEVDSDGRVIFHVKDDGTFKVHKDWLVGDDGIEQVKKEFPERVDKVPQGKVVSTPKRSTEKQLAENRGSIDVTEKRLQDAKDNLAEAHRIKNDKMSKVWQDEVDREQRVYDIAKNINSPIKTENNGNTEDAQSDKAGQSSSKESQDGRKESNDGLEQKSGNVKAKIIDNQLLQPAKLKGTDYHLALAKLPDGSHAIIDTNSGLVISKPYEDEYSARIAYSKNREKLSPEIIQKAKDALEIKDDTPQKKVAQLTPKAKAEVDADLKQHGITYDQIKDYEQQRTGLPSNDRQQPESVSEDIQQHGNDTGAGTDKNPESEAVRPQPESAGSSTKSDDLRRNLEDAKADLSKELKKARGKLSSGVDPELLKSMAKVIKAYADIGIHKFSEIVKDWVNTFKDEVTDEDYDALKGAYAAHVANLDPKERKNFNTLKELDDFMANRKESAASLPKFEPRAEPRLPIPKSEKAEKPELKKSYSKLSALKSYGIRNLEQLKAFAKDIKDFDAYREVRKYATSKSQASVILKTATKGITNLVGKAGWEQMRTALVESRLRGIRDRWNGYADEVANMSDSQIKTIFDDGQEGNMYDLVKNLQPLQGEANPAKFAVSLISGGRYDDAKQYLSDVYKKAADNVLTLGIPFDEMVKDGKFTDPKMQQALEIYKDLLEKPIAESHASNEGIFSDSLGDLKTYYPLTGENANEKARLLAKGKPFNEPQNVNNKFATGQSGRYSTDIADLSDKLTQAIKVNNKANALDALKKVGLITDVAHNAPDTQEMQVGNDVWDFVKEKVGDSKTIITPDGNIVNIPSKYVMMPKWLKGELDPIFNSTDGQDKYNFYGKFFNALTKVALGGPTEAIAHSYRMLGVITNSVPFMQEWAYKNGIAGEAGGYVANNPFVKKWTGLQKILTTDISSSKALQTIQEMSKLGIIPEKTWTKTWSREFAELTGAKASRIKIGKLDIPNFTDFSPVLYGKNSIDLKARVMMYNLVKAMNPEATPEQHVKMQNELGVYTKALQGQLERQIKETGLAPYYTFGSGVYRSALKAVTGTSPLPLDARANPGQFARYKAAQLLTNGIIGSVAAWMLTYHAQTGNWPWEDETSKLGRLPMPEWAKNDLTAKFFTDAKGDWKDINMLATTNPIVERGLRATGAEKAYETNQLGGSIGQNIEAGATQAANTAASPFTSSPALQFATTLFAGSAPYVTGLRDDKGKPSPQLYKKVKAVDYGIQPLANTYSAFKELNPLIDATITGTNKYTGMEKSIFGLNSVTNSDVSNEGSPLGFILNMAFPRFFVPHGSDEAKAHFIEKNRNDLEKTISKEQEKEGE